MEFGHTIARWRKRRGLTQTQLSQKSGLSQVFISLIERGSKTPSIDSLESIAKALEVPLALIVFQSTTPEDIGNEARRAVFEELSSSLNALADEAFK